MRIGNGGRRRRGCGRRGGRGRVSASGWGLSWVRGGRGGEGRCWQRGQMKGEVRESGRSVITVQCDVRRIVFTPYSTHPCREIQIRPIRTPDEHFVFFLSGSWGWGVYGFHLHIVCVCVSIGIRVLVLVRRCRVFLVRIYRTRHRRYETSSALKSR